jgi:hypothetical protein
MRRARWSQMLNCLGHIVIAVDQERNHDAIEDLEWVSLARHPFVAATTLPVRRIQTILALFGRQAMSIYRP